MSKKILLSYTTIAAIILFNIYSNAYARSLFAGQGEDKTAPTQESYENVYALDGGKIHGTALKITGPSTQEESIITDISGVEARKFGSMIELEGDTTIKNVSIGLLAKESGTIKMNDGSIQVKKMHIQTPIGIAAVSNGDIILNNVEIDASNQEQSIKTIDETGIGDGTGASLKSGGTLSMTGGSIKSNYLGITLEESNSDKNKLENVKINITDLVNSTKESIGIRVIKTSKVTLDQVTIRHARTSIHASDSSQITISGGLIQGNHTGINVEKESVITLKNDVEVLSNDHGLSANGLHSKITMQGGKLTTAGLQPAVLAGFGGEINLTNVVVHIDDLTDIGMHIDDNETQTQKLELERKEAPLTTQGLQAQYAQSKITMIRGSITTTGLNPAVLAGSGGQIDLTNVPMKVHNVGLQAQAEQSKIVMTRGSIITTGMNPAVLAGSGGQIDLNDVVIKTRDIALQAQDKQSKITMRGGKLIKTGPRAAIFVTCGGQIDLLGVQLHTDSNGLAVRGRESKITLKDSEVRANILLVGRPNEGENGEANVIADHSILEGGARNSERNPTQTIFSLINGTKWYLKVNTQNYKIQKLDPIKNLHSEVFKLNLNNSTIVFRTPREDQYQTLHIGSKSPHLTNNNTTYETVYHATGDAKIYFNTEYIDGLPKEQQTTDRLLIHGDVSGTTTVHFRNLLKGKKTKEKNTGPVNTRGLSLVQVSGKADENSFKLANGYTTIKGLPYKYTLNAYGPTASHGKASIEQSFVGEKEDFWDFRLQNAILDSEETILPDIQETNFFDVEEITSLNTEETASLDDGETTPLYSKKASSSDTEEISSPDIQETNFFDAEEITSLNTEETASLDAEGKIRALVPQVASYLVMPNALFSTGLADLNNQNILLENMRATLFEGQDNKEVHKRSGIFLSSYGNKITLSSNRSPLHYGYGADIQYTAVSAGVTLTALEGQNSTTHFGLLGIYGKLAFTPKGMAGADKSTLDKWSLAAYGNVQHNDGMYVHALFSYGALNGNITTALIGNTATLDSSHTVSASATIGHKLATDTKGLVFEPQAQLVYQRLMFGTISDIDGFNVNIGNPQQWLLRVGGRLTKTTLLDEKGYATAFYGKLNFMKTFSDKNTVQIGDTFHLDTIGASIEGGLGMNAQLSQNFALQADINYQHKLQKAGVSGINFSGGIRYQF